jgi:Heparinase II/III-like protein
MSRWARLLDRWGPTVRAAQHLRASQLLAFVRQRSQGPARVPLQSRAVGCDALMLPEGFDGPSPEGIPQPDGSVVLLGQPAHDPLRFGWEAPDDPLWAYTLHYHGWLGDPRCDPEHAIATMLDWIEEHPQGVGWEPYPTSLRILHWLGVLARTGERLHAGELELVLASLSAQLQHLAQHVEVHLDGNHLWTNLAALVAGGLALGGPVPQLLVDRFAQRLLAVVYEQLASDGVHRERTPSYHCLLGEQLAIVVVLAEPRMPGLADPLRIALRRMVDALASFTHADGDVALWGDSQLGAPVTPRRLAARIGRELEGGDADARASGFSRRVWGPFTLLWNRGGVGMPQQVGHIHGDALALELDVGTTRVLVDAGVGSYLPGSDRDYVRSTRAHNTATVGAGDPDQHELWKSHRIGARAHPLELACSERELAGEVLGWRSPAVHRRRVRWDGEAIHVEDVIDRIAPATVRWFVPAELTVRVEAAQAVVFVPRGPTLELTLDRGRFVASDAPGWCAMNTPAPRTCLAVAVEAGAVALTIRALR